jgi:hypothetical protein
MAWESEKLDRTLLIEKLPSATAGQFIYKLRNEMRVLNLDGTTYLETVPFELFVQGGGGVYTFNHVEFVDFSGDGRTAKACDTSFTNFGASVQRRTA